VLAEDRTIGAFALDGRVTRSAHQEMIEKDLRQVTASVNRLGPAAAGIDQLAVVVIIAEKRCAEMGRKPSGSVSRHTELLTIEAF
jgi:hypothetical protein